MANTHTVNSHNGTCTLVCVCVCIYVCVYVYVVAVAVAVAMFVSVSVSVSVPVYQMQILGCMHRGRHVRLDVRHSSLCHMTHDSCRIHMCDSFMCGMTYSYA